MEREGSPICPADAFLPTACRAVPAPAAIDIFSILNGDDLFGGALSDVRRTSPSQRPMVVILRTGQCFAAAF